MEDKKPFIPHSQYLGQWCRDDARSQGISSHGFDLVLFDPRRINPLCAKLFLTNSMTLMTYKVQILNPCHVFQHWNSTGSWNISLWKDLFLFFLFWGNANEWHLQVQWHEVKKSILRWLWQTGSWLLADHQRNGIHHSSPITEEQGSWVLQAWAKGPLKIQ